MLLGVNKRPGREAPPSLDDFYGKGASEALAKSTHATILQGRAPHGVLRVVLKSDEGRLRLDVTEEGLVEHSREGRIAKISRGLKSWRKRWC